MSLTLDEALIRLEDLQSIVETRDAAWKTLLAIPAKPGEPALSPVACALRERIETLDARANAIAAEVEEWRAS